MFEEELAVRIDTFDFLLSASYTSHDYNLVHCINKMINDHNIHPNADTFRSMIVAGRFVRRREAERLQNPSELTDHWI
ncbi:unnamed protein product [Lactuca virosa]|uniref:Pentatricopeptide repeat-containing protein n=1 Tax=Lactuca virosa TaxID=75947 RepID=A0AAU9NEE5_9ASTR|nr:unnamed protein product [Lactuca virosa]CAH1436226.1 unnamed protein product [Lactuca virosa]